MKGRKRRRREAKPRIFLAAAIVAISIVAFLLIRSTLVESRGYAAMGGEYLIIPAGMLLAYLVCWIICSSREQFGEELKALSKRSKELKCQRQELQFQQKRLKQMKTKLILVEGSKQKTERRTTNAKEI